MPVIDTTLLIDIDRRPDHFLPVLDALHQEGEPLVVPIQVAIEFATGKQVPAAALRFLDDDFTLHAPDLDTARFAAEVAADALRAGVFPGWPDVQVAATAVQLGMEVVTRNVSHFEAMGVRARSYPTPGTP